MKYFFSVTCLLISLMSKAQIVNIPDSNFKNFLLSYQPAIDINNDGEIQQAEASIVTTLIVTGSPGSLLPITNITGIRSFTSLKHLTSIYTTIANFDVSDLNQLTSVELSFNDSMSSVNFNGCISIDSLRCESNIRLTSLNVSSCTNLKSFSCRSNRINHLILGTLDSLSDIDCSGLLIDTLDLRKYKNLKHIYSNPSYFTYADFSNLKLLSSITLESDFTFNGPIHLYLSGCTSLEVFQTGTLVALQYLNLDSCINLKILNLDAPNLISTLDLSSCPALTSFFIDADNLKYLNLKNGSIASTVLIAHFSTDTLNICVDEFEMDHYQLVNRNNDPNDIRNLSSYCSFFPGGNYNTIKGKVSIDANNNGCDNNDLGMSGVTLKIKDSSGNTYLRYSAPNGEYGFYPYNGIFTITPYFAYPWFAITPAITSITFDTANSLTNINNFCISPNGIHNDLEISFLPTGSAARPGFEAGYTLVYKNRGTTTLSGNVQVNFDNSKMNFVAASQNVITQSTGQLLWNYNNLRPFESKTIYVTFNLLPPPVNNIGDTIIYLAAITPSANDETSFDNSFILPQRIRGSFDPNEKQCLEGSKIDISKIGEYLHYQVHFQNEGTDTAFNIVVVDTLSDKLDWNTLELINSSHQCSVNIKNNKAEFIFENIKLPYKAINEPASNGYVAFKIKPKASVIVGDSLNNTAAIYFDFNMPVITNRATTIVTNAFSPVPVKIEYFSINSRNNINTLNWKAACSNGSAKFSIERSADGIHFSNIGSVTATAIRCQLPFNFSDNDPVTGKNYYRLKITDADGISFYSKVLVTGNNKAGLEISAISNNFNSSSSKTIYYIISKQQQIKLQVINADGKLVYTGNRNVAAGAGQINLQLKNLAAGVYTLVVLMNEEIVTKRFIK